MQIKPLGDTVLLVSLEQKIDKTIHEKVLSLMNMLEKEQLDGILEMVPAYSSLAIFYDPGILTYSNLEERVRAWNYNPSTDTEKEKILWEIPVCYTPDFGADLQDYSQKINLPVEEIIRLHTSADYRVYMLGFIPGFIYLGGLIQELHLNRKATPAAEVPAGSIAVGGEQTGIYSLSSPGGWHVIGRTPCQLFDSGGKDIVSVKPGDVVRFISITEEDFRLIYQDDKRRDIINYKKGLNG